MQELSLDPTGAADSRGLNVPVANFFYPGLIPVIFPAKPKILIHQNDCDISFAWLAFYDPGNPAETLRRITIGAFPGDDAGRPALLRLGVHRGAAVTDADGLSIRSAASVEAVALQGPQKRLNTLIHENSVFLGGLEFPQQLHDRGGVLLLVAALHPHLIPLDHVIAVEVGDAQFIAQFPGQLQVLQAHGDW